MNGILSFLEKVFFCTEGVWSAWRPTVIAIGILAPVGNRHPGRLHHDCENLSLKAFFFVLILFVLRGAYLPAFQ